MDFIISEILGTVFDETVHRKRDFLLFLLFPIIGNDSESPSDCKSTVTDRGGCI